MKSHLHSVLKTVVRGDTGKPHQQHYWLGAKDIQKIFREKDLAGTVEYMRADPKAVRLLINGYSERNGGAVSAVLAGAAAARAGLDPLTDLQRYQEMRRAVGSWDREELAHVASDANATSQAHYPKSLDEKPGFGTMRSGVLDRAHEEDVAVYSKTLSDEQIDRMQFEHQESVEAGKEPWDPLGDPMEWRESSLRTEEDEPLDRPTADVSVLDDIVRDQMLEGAGDLRTRYALSAMSTISRAMHDNKPVTVYRGVSMPRAELDAALARAQETGFLELRTNVVTSFTESQGVASRFAAHGIGPGDGGFVIRTVLPPQSMLWSHRIFPRRELHPEGSIAPTYSHEAEIVGVTNGSLRIPLRDVAVWIRDSDPYPDAHPPFGNAAQREFSFAHRRPEGSW